MSSLWLAQYRLWRYAPLPAATSCTMPPRPLAIMSTHFHGVLFRARSRRAVTSTTRRFGDRAAGDEPEAEATSSPLESTATSVDVHGRRRTPSAVRVTLDARREARISGSRRRYPSTAEGGVAENNSKFRSYRVLNMICRH